MPAFEYETFTLSFVAPTNDVTLGFLFRNDFGTFDLDNVSVVDASAVPEPTSLTIWSLTALGAGVFYRRRRLAKA
jgi:hypothetical protein